MKTPTDSHPLYGQMEHQVSQFAPETVRINIDALDFAAIKQKLQDPHHGLGWDKSKVDRIELMYRRFLFLQTTTPDAIVPTTDIDDFWHQHILDTRKYPRDCQNAFGFLLHHFPYFGLRGGDDARKLEEAFERSGTLYENTFGETYAADPAARSINRSGDSTSCSSCG
ncbi:MAG: hypothetical protein Q7S86_05235 [bacterium]|nr:hypothetical protein [bacterium]